MATVINPDAGDDEPLRIKLDDEPAGGEPAAGDGVAAPPPSPAAPPPSVGIDDLKRQIAASQQQRDAAAQAARAATQQRDQAMAVAAEAQRRGVSAEQVLAETRLNADEAVVTTRLAAAQQEMDALTETQQAAYEAGDFKKVAELNAKMNRAGGQVALFEWQKQQLEQQRQQLAAWQQQQAYAAQQQQAAAAQQRQQDPVEAYISSRSAPTQQFMRKHREKIFRPDGSLRRIALDAHETALDDGLKIDTPDYFRRVEEILGGGGLPPQQQQGERTRQHKDGAAAPPRPKGPPSTAAPVSRETLGQGSEFVMTPHMRQLAHEQMGSSTREAEVEWFQNYVRAVREGRMEPITQ